MSTSSRTYDLLGAHHSELDLPNLLNRRRRVRESDRHRAGLIPRNRSTSNCFLLRRLTDTCDTPSTHASSRFTVVDRKIETGVIPTSREKRDERKAKVRGICGTQAMERLNPRPKIESEGDEVGWTRA